MSGEDRDEGEESKSHTLRIKLPLSFFTVFHFFPRFFSPPNFPRLFYSIPSFRIHLTVFLSPAPFSSRNGLHEKKEKAREPHSELSFFNNENNNNTAATKELFFLFSFPPDHRVSLNQFFLERTRFPPLSLSVERGE